MATPARLRAGRVRLSLSRERTRFLETQQPDEVFAVFYHHVTEGVLAMADSGKLRQPEFWLDEVDRFHDAYLLSRSPATRPAHWRAYYETAATIGSGNLKGWQVAGPGDLLGAPGLASLAVRAHIRGDLSASLEAVRRMHPEASIGPGCDLEKDFNDMSPVFTTAARLGFCDISRVLNPTGPTSLDCLPARDAVTAWLILRERKQAWNEFQTRAH